jgi:hypothetical protein
MDGIDIDDDEFIFCGKCGIHTPVYNRVSKLNPEAQRFESCHREKRPAPFLCKRREHCTIKNKAKMYLDPMKWRSKMVVDHAGTTKHPSVMAIDTPDVTLMFKTRRALLVWVTASLVSEELLDKNINLRYPRKKGVILQCMSSCEGKGIEQLTPKNPRLRLMCSSRMVLT